MVDKPVFQGPSVLFEIRRIPKFFDPLSWKLFAIKRNTLLIIRTLYASIFSFLKKEFSQTPSSPFHRSQQPTYSTYICQHRTGNLFSTRTPRGEIPFALNRPPGLNPPNDHFPQSKKHSTQRLVAFQWYKCPAPPFAPAFNGVLVIWVKWKAGPEVPRIISFHDPSCETEDLFTSMKNRRGKKALAYKISCKQMLDNRNGCHVVFLFSFSFF